MLTVHHLSYSRSTRVLWLLEELSTPYALVRYERDASFKAPPALQRVHPLGKAPVIQDGDLVVGESAVILEYINETYGGGRFAPARGGEAHLRHQEWLHYVEGTAAFPILISRIGAVTGGLTEKMEQFVKPVLAKTLNHIEAAVGGDYLMGSQFTLADIQISYVLEVADSAGMLAGHPQILAYLDRIKARPAFAKAVEVGGPMMPTNR